MSTRAERRRARSDREHGLRRTVSVLRIGDLASDLRLAAIRADHEMRLADPLLSGYARTELLKSLETVRVCELVLAACDPKRPRAPTEAH